MKIRQSFLHEVFSVFIGMKGFDMQRRGWKISIAALFVAGFLLTALRGARAEQVAVHANVVWEMTDAVAQEGMILTWEVDKRSVWSCNPRLFPDGHNADGIPVNALKGYVFPSQAIGRLVGRFGDCGRMFPMGNAGSIRILPDEDGEFLYLTMNDDILGLYGKGFKDNEGVLIVNISQSVVSSK